MTMARIKDDKVVAVGLPESLESTEPDRLYALGWRPVKGLPKPTDGSGYEYTHPFTYDADEDAVYGTWQQTDVLNRINDAKAKGIREQRDALLDESDFAYQLNGQRNQSLNHGVPNAIQRSGWLCDAFVRLVFACHLGLDQTAP